MPGSVYGAPVGAPGGGHAYPGDSGTLPAPSSYTYNADGTVATETVAGVATAYTYNTDGTVATMTRAGATRTFTYNTDGTIAGVA